FISGLSGIDPLDNHSHIINYILKLFSLSQLIASTPISRIFTGSSNNKVTNTRKPNKSHWVSTKSNPQPTNFCKPTSNQSCSCIIMVAKALDSSSTNCNNIL